MAWRSMGVLAVVCAVCLLGSVRAADTVVRLLDARAGVPLEYWVTEVPLPRKGVLYGVAPKGVVLDGRMLLFRASDKAGSDVLSHPAGEAAPTLDREAPGAGATWKSDRENAVANQPKLQVAAALAAGEHTVVPGDGRFRVEANGGVAALDPALALPDAHTVTVACLAVDLNFPPTAGGDLSLAVQVSAGGTELLAFAARPAGPSAVRVFLPAATAPYHLHTNRGDADFILSATGVALVPASIQPAAGARLLAEGFQVVLASALPADTVVPPPAAPTSSGDAELYLFNDRNREVYQEGERVTCSVRAYGPAVAGPAHFTLVAQAVAVGAPVAATPPLDLGTVPLALGAAELELPTAALRPGRYELRARVGATASNPLPLTVALAMPATDFSLFGHGKWGSASFAPDDLAVLVSSGMNSVTESPAPTHGGTTVRANVSPLSAWYARGKVLTDAGRFHTYQRAHFPSELLTLPNEHQAGGEYLLAHGIENRPVSGLDLILYFNVGQDWLDMAEDRAQGVAHLGMEWRRFPNFTGVAYASGDGMTPASIGMVWASAGVASFDVIHDARLKRLQEVFKASVGDIKIDNSDTMKEFQRIGAQMQGAWGFGVGMEDKTVIQADDEKKMRWLAMLNDLYPQSFQMLHDALAAQIPAPLITGGSTWGFGIGGGMHPPLLYRHAQQVTNDQHGDYGTLPFHNLSEADYAGLSLDQPQRRTREVIDLIQSTWSATGTKFFLQALSRNPEGIGVYNLAQDQVAGRWGQEKLAGEDLARLMDLGRRFGGVYRQLVRRDEVAVVSSFRQGALGGQPVDHLLGAHYLAQKAGWQATMVTEEYCVQHPDLLPKLFKALYFVDMSNPLPPAFKAAVTAFQQQGGVVLGDPASADAMPGVIAVPAASLKGSNTNDVAEIEATFRPLAATFRAAVGARLPAFFTTTPAFDVNAIRSVDEDLEYWTVFNDAKDPATLAKDGVGAQFTYAGTAATLAARGARGTLYDALRRTVVATTATADGLACALDLRLHPGTVLLLAPRPVAALTLAHTGSVAPGALLTITAQAQDAAGQVFAGHLPVCFTVTDPQGVVRYQVYRRTHDTVTLKIAANDPPGAWAIAAAEQATGLQAASTFAVAGPAPAVAVQPRLDDVYDAHAVQALVQQQPTEIVLWAEQEAALGASARALAQRLQAAGCAATVRVLWPAQFRQYPMQWRYDSIEDLEIRQAMLSGATVGERVVGKNQLGDRRTDSKGTYAFYSDYTGSASLVYYHHVILLGRADAPSNPLLDQVQALRLLPRPVSPNYPGPGRGLVGYTWSPFHYGHDAVVLYGRDAAGLQQATDALVTVAATKTPIARADTPRPARLTAENGQVYATMLGLAPPPATVAATAPAAALVTVTGTTRDTTPLLPPGRARRITDAAFDDGGALLLRQTLSGSSGGAPLVAVDLAQGRAIAYTLPAAMVPTADLDVLRRWRRGDSGAAPNAGLPPPDLVLGAGGMVLPLGLGLAQLPSAAGPPRWYVEPFPVPSTYDEAQFERPCKRFLLAADGRTALATFYDQYPSQKEPVYFNPAVTVLVDLATGKLIARLPGFQGSYLGLAADGSRGVLADLGGTDAGGRGRRVKNPYGESVVAFDRTGKELCHLPIHGPVEQWRVSRDASVVLVSYGDARHYVSLFDLDAGTEQLWSTEVADTGVALAPDGSLAVVVTSDGLVKAYDRHGAPLWRAALPAAGVPAVAADGSVAVAANDGVVHRLGDDDQPAVEVPFADAPVTALPDHWAAPPAGLSAPVPSGWDTAGPGVTLKVLPTVPFAPVLSPVPETTFTVDLPTMGPLDTLLVRCSYRLQQPAARLTVTWDAGKGEVRTFVYPYRATPTRIALPLRAASGTKVALRLAAPGGFTLDEGRLLHYQLPALANAAYSPASVGKAQANAAAVRVLVPNVQGLVGDPRREQMAYGWTIPAREKVLRPFPPGVDEHSVTNANLLVDGLPYSGTPLYPVIFPLNQPWDAPGTQPYMRTAQVLIEYQQARTCRGLGVWEQLGDLPLSAWTLEVCDKYLTDPLTKELKGEWKLVASGRNNLDFYHAHWFKPVTARCWRFTILSTPSHAQRLAELELYEDALSAIEQDLTGDAPGGAKPKATGLDPGF